MVSSSPPSSGSDHTLVLPDGRTLAWREHGDPHGVPVFYFHGFPGSRLEAGYFPTPGIRLMAVDRPGYGRSTAAPRRRLADWPGDIARLADAAGLGRFAVLGISGGGPYAAACAHALSDRLAAAAIVCGLGPPEAPGMRAGSLNTLLSLGRRPMAAGLITGLARRILLSPRAERRLMKARARMAERRAAGVPKERAALTDGFTHFMLGSWREGLRLGANGMVSDARVYGEPWPFSLSELRIPLHLWHGTDDRVVPVSIAQHYSAHVPGIKVHIHEGDGHFSVIGTALGDIIRTLRAAFAP